MNELYLTIMFLVATCGLLLLIFGPVASEIEICGGIMIIVSVFMLLFSGIFPIGYDILEYSDATNTRVGNDLIIQSKFPVQTISDIKFINKNVRVVKVANQNAWGGDLGVSYRVEEAPAVEKD